MKPSPAPIPGRTRHRWRFNIIFPNYIQATSSTRPSDPKAWRSPINAFSVIPGLILLPSCPEAFNNPNYFYLFKQVTSGPTPADLTQVGDRENRFLRLTLPQGPIQQAVSMYLRMNMPSPWQTDLLSGRTLMAPSSIGSKSQLWPAINRWGGSLTGVRRGRFIRENWRRRGRPIPQARWGRPSRLHNSWSTNDFSRQGRRSTLPWPHRNLGEPSALPRMGLR